eukprot:3159133-Rhodomonas_salina.4
MQCAAADGEVPPSRSLSDSDTVTRLWSSYFCWNNAAQYWTRPPYKAACSAGNKRQQPHLRHPTRTFWHHRCQRTAALEHCTLDSQCERTVGRTSCFWRAISGTRKR